MTDILVERGDITTYRVDAIVNAANETLMGGGGVDGAIHRAAGPDLRAECETLGGCKRGEAKITRGYNLRAPNVIHTVGPIWRGGDNGEAEALASCYKNSLDLAKKYSAYTIAIPAISTGIYAYPLEEAAHIATKTVKDWVTANDGALDEIIFVCFSQEAVEAFEAGMAA